jgi:hypothetical protein
MALAPTAPSQSRIERIARFSQQMPLERLCRAIGAWLYRKVCYAEQQDILSLLDTVVQNTQGVLLQLETARQLIPQDSPAKEELRVSLRRAESMLDHLREQTELRTRRCRVRSEGR